MPTPAALQFVNDLAAITTEQAGLQPGTYFNPWRETCPHMDLGANAPERRKQRLAAHLSNPSLTVLLCGEAPGYQGCRFSGMAFTSERLLMEGAIPGITALQDRLTKRKLPYSEPSATIVWGTLWALGLEQKVALWNAFPFHPMKHDEPLSNRTPTPTELKFGATILSTLLTEVLPGVRLIAIGAKASETVTSFSVPWRRSTTTTRARTPRTSKPRHNAQPHGNMWTGSSHSSQSKNVNRLRARLGGN